MIRVDLNSWRFKTGTNWCAFLTSQNRPNSASINDLCELDDGRIAFIGGAAHNVIETPDAWDGNYLRGGSGDHFGIFSGDFKDLLFCSRMPNCELMSLASKAIWSSLPGGHSVRAVDAIAKLVVKQLCSSATHCRKSLVALLMPTLPSLTQE